MRARQLVRSVLGAAALCLPFVSGGCDKVACAGVQGGCLALHVTGTGTYDKLEGVLLSTAGSTIQVGDSLTAATLPALLQILPPPGVATALAGSIHVFGYRSALAVAEGAVGLSWPDGAKVEYTVVLENGVPDLATPVDMNGDLNPG